MTIGANTILVLAGCALFGAVAGATGTFVLARRRALVSDVAGPGRHCCLVEVGLDRRPKPTLFKSRAASELAASVDRGVEGVNAVARGGDCVAGVASGPDLAERLGEVLALVDGYPLVALLVASVGAGAHGG